MGSFDSTPAPKPDPAIGQAALKQAQIGEQYLSFAKDAFAVSQGRQTEIDALAKTVTDKQLAIADEQAGYAREDRARYKDVYQPLEDQFIQESKDYASPERQAAAAAEARAGVLSAADMERGAAERRAAGLGINPASGRYAGIERSGELGTAVAAAGAENTARANLRDKAIALKADAIGLGRGLPAQSTAAQSLGLNAGASGFGITGKANDAYIGSTGIMGQGYGGAAAGYAGQASTLSSLYNDQLASWKAQQQSDASGAAGFGNLLGVGLSFLSSRKAKTGKTTIPDGKALAAVKGMPVEKWKYKEGDNTEHMGTYAEDFTKATGTGDGKRIEAVDAIGITMKAVQDLDKKVEKLSVGLGKPKAKSTPMRRAA